MKHLPAIILFPREAIIAGIDHIENSTKDDLISLSGKQEMKDIPQIPELLIDNTDRNCTSFASPKPFEFRAVGSEATVLSRLYWNPAVADQLRKLKKMWML